MRTVVIDDARAASDRAPAVSGGWFPERDPRVRRGFLNYEFAVDEGSRDPSSTCRRTARGSGSRPRTRSSRSTRTCTSFARTSKNRALQAVFVAPYAIDQAVALTSRGALSSMPRRSPRDHPSPISTSVRCWTRSCTETIWGATHRVGTFLDFLEAMGSDLRREGAPAGSGASSGARRRLRRRQQGRGDLYAVTAGDLFVYGRRSTTGTTRALRARAPSRRPQGLLDGVRARTGAAATPRCEA